MLDGAVEDVVQSRLVESIFPTMERSRGYLIGVNSDAGLEREGCLNLAHDPDRVCHELRDIHVQQIRVRGVVLLIDAKKIKISVTFCIVTFCVRIVTICVNCDMLRDQL